ncbi:CobD/CbiB family protein [Nitrogeniibacter mangrovi]|uniref:Cobalamin biosynthesis protein CobD n=1 Tax=Nitrogeniibacter mangrovi TaxID=2016596 RepID=A0A6C1B3V4_9RHOO|nr:CobD/CbiB family protein [Nitrogeniibacter mangrovi]QID18227.1 CobD/CbiB family protein [Nitrogeniibacter mangrovi]
MSLVVIVLALLIEQVRPLPVERWVRSPLSRVAAWIEERFNDGRLNSGRAAWLVFVAGGTALTWAAHGLLWALHPVLAFLFSLGVLYLTMGIRHESHFFTDIHVALRLGDLGRARTLLAEWSGADCGDADAQEVTRLAIEQAFIAAHRNVYGPIFWFLVLPGPAGAVFYRLASVLDRIWGTRQDDEIGRFGVAARQVFHWIDWLPVRLTAFSFSVVGNFEDALLCWRTQATQWAHPSSGILLSSGGGALGVRLGLPRHESGRIVDRPELGCGDDARIEFMQGAVGLIWRALCLCLLVLALMGIAAWVAP